MNKSDKYYLKKGKLELSMLDEDEYEHTIEPIINSKPRDLFNNLEFEHTRRLRDIHKKEEQRPQQLLKVSKEVYNTLHTMGKFLTKIEPQVSNVPTKKSMNLAKAQKLEQIASSIKVQEIELPPILNKQSDSTSLNISNTEQNTNEIEERVNLSSIESDEVAREYTQVKDRREESHPIRTNTDELETTDVHSHHPNQEVYRETDETIGRGNEIEEQIESSYKEVSQMAVLSNELVNSMEDKQKINPIKAEKTIDEFLNSSEESSGLDQNNIDHIVASFFKSNEPQYAFSKELKKHIDKHIMAIKNYK